MALKDSKGNYWLKFEEFYTCSECKKPINDEEKIFIDGIGTFHKRKGMIEMGKVQIYHYKCIIVE